MQKNQIAKCTVSGFLAGFGGFIAMPVAIPANLTSVFYAQMRMIACTAYMAGYDLQSDQTQIKNSGCPLFFVCRNCAYPLLSSA